MIRYAWVNHDAGFTLIGRIAYYILLAAAR
jgi:hypothetical protein